MDEFIAVIAILSAVALPIIVALVVGIQLISSRHKERIAMIQQGIVPNEVEKPEKKANRYTALRNGLFMVGLAVGVLVGIFLTPLMPEMSEWEYFLIPTIAVLFGGIAFMVYFFLSRKMQLKEKETDNQSGFTE